jgi:hypothetical protein
MKRADYQSAAGCQPAPHPVCARREFLALAPEGHAKDFVRRYAAHYLDTLDAGVLSDIEDPEAYRALRESAR